MRNGRGLDPGAGPFSERVYRALLRLYPQEFRAAFGEDLTLTFCDLLREEGHRGAARRAGLWIRTLIDLLATALAERLETMQRDGSWKWLPVALALGIAIAYIDSRPTWDDTGISAAELMGAAALMGAASPARAWRWALAVGLWIPLFGILRHHDFTMLLVLGFTFAGAYAGAFLRRAFGETARPA